MPLLDQLFTPENANLLGIGLLGATGNKNAAKKLAMLNLINQSNQSTQSTPDVLSGINPHYTAGVPPSTQNTVNNLMQGINPRLQSALPIIMDELRQKGWQPSIASGMRTPEEQAEKVRQGYSQTMNSKHLIGKAVDIIDKRYGWDGPASDTNYQFWQDLGEAAKRQGLQWGGDWKNFKDVAHIQTSFLNQNPQQRVGLLNQQNYIV